MRLCADPKSPFYRLPHVKVAHVFLDGKRERLVLELDTTEGWLIALRKNARGRQEAVTLRGRVMITLPEREELL